MYGLLAALFHDRYRVLLAVKEPLGLYIAIRSDPLRACRMNGLEGYAAGLENAHDLHRPHHGGVTRQREPPC